MVIIMNIFNLFLIEIIVIGILLIVTSAVVEIESKRYTIRRGIDHTNGYYIASGIFIMLVVLLYFVWLNLCLIDWVNALP